jgi:putative cardiolipin synthase
MRSAHANFIDMDVLSAGPVVREQSQVFDRYWNNAIAWPVQDVVPLALPADAAVRRFDELVRAAAPEFAPSTSDPLGRASVDYELAAGRVSLVFAPAAVFADRPDKASVTVGDEDVATVTRSVVEELRAARSQVLIASPYFIPGAPGMASLRYAVDRGVKVSVLTNSVGATDEPLVHYRYARYRKQMLELGVELKEVGPGAGTGDPATFGDFGQSYRRLHAKIAVIDERKVFIGSMNFDARSAWSNTEAGLLIESPELAVALHQLVSRDHGETIYRLRLADDGDTIQWTWRGADGRLLLTTEEPHNSWWLRLKMLLLEPFAAEELL